MKNFEQAFNGLETEIRFKESVEKMGFKAHKVGVAYDIKHHFDINISANIEIKGMKALRRGDEVQDDWHWIEIQGVRDDGWLYESHANLIAFETKKSWILVRPTNLIEYVQRFVEHTYVDKPILAQYKLYRRKNRNDAITLIRCEDLRRVGIEWLK